MLIFHGKVIERKITESDNAFVKPGAIFVFQVDRAWKGPTSEQIEVSVSTTEGSLCGYDFSVGWTGVVFASGDVQEPNTDLCQMAPYTWGKSSDYDDLLPEHRQSGHLYKDSN